MSEHEQENEIKITDRRKFNLDGSLRDGVTLEAEKPKVEEPKNTPPIEEPPPETPSAPIQEPDETTEEFSGDAEEEFDGSQIPGAEDPASFANFLLSLASQAAAALGLAEHPATGQRRVDLELSKYWLDVLGMLREKTANNLHPKEQQLFDGLLSDLRMQFVALNRAAAEQLKKQAAQKFSAKDILGR